MIRILFALTWLIVVHPVFAIDTAARISDREIIESLAEIKAGQKVLEDKMDQRFIATQEQMNLRFAAVDQRFASIQDQMDHRFNSIQELMDQRFTSIQEQMDQRFTSVQEQMDVRFTAVDQRFENIDRRLDFIENLMLVLIAGIFGLIGFIVWDRYSTLRPMDMRLRRIEEDLEHDLELKSPEGSRVTRMIHALRELAKEDKKVEAVLKSFSLL